MRLTDIRLCFETHGVDGVNLKTEIVGEWLEDYIDIFLVFTGLTGEPLYMVMDEPCLRTYLLHILQTCTQ